MKKALMLTQRISVWIIVPCLMLLSCRKTEQTAWSEAQLRGIWFPPKSVMHNMDSVWATGHWKQIRFGLITRIPVLNAVSIECSKLTNTCTETRADLYSPLDKPAMFNEHLRLDPVRPETYQVQSWSSDGVIIATAFSDSADIDLRISVADKVVEKSYRETRARGYSKSDPKVVHVWVLE
jgi:hypothetical protein